MTCSNCEEIESTERGENCWAIARLRHGYVSLNPTQYYVGATFYVAKPCVAELHELERHDREGHLMEMASVAAAVFHAVGARKMNYEALGNYVPHLHWWLTPRHHDDPRPRGPIWEDLDFLRAMWSGDGTPGLEQGTSTRMAIMNALEAQGVEIEASYL